MKYNCCECKKQFKRKKDFEKHLDICEWMKMLYIKNNDDEKINNENKDRTIEIMKKMMETLYTKCIDLESQVTELKRFVDKTKKKINILTWLNENKNPKYSFIDFIDDFKYSEKHLNYIFDRKFVDGLYYVIQEIFDIEKLHNHPICCFKQKSNLFYIWNKEENKWKIMCSKDFDLFISRVHLHIMEQFQLWTKKNQEKINNSDKFHDKYLENMREVTGGNKDKEQYTRLIKSKIYNYLKMNIKDIIQYEFTF